MKIKFSSIYATILYVTLVSQMLILVGLPFRLNRLVSLGVWSIAFCGLLSLVMLFLESNIKFTIPRELVYICVLILLVLFSLFMTFSINVASMVKVITFLQLPTFLFVANRSSKHGNRESIYKINMLYPVLFLLLYFSSFSHRFIGEYGEMIHEYLTLGYNNPNETAMYLMICYIILLSAFYHYTTKIKKLWVLLDLVTVGFMIYQTDCRAVIVLCLVVTLITVFAREITVGKWTLIFVFAAPIAITILMIIFPSVARLEFMGETIENGRLGMIMDYLDNLKPFDFVFGNFTKYPLNNMHNAPLSVLASFGILAFVTFWLTLHNGYRKLCQIRTNQKEVIALLLGLLGLVVYSVVESALMVSGSVYSASVFLLAYMVASANQTKGSEISEDIAS